MVENPKGRQKIPREENIEQLIQEAEKDVMTVIKALERAGLDIENRHTVIIPGNKTSPDESRKLLRQEIIENNNEVGIYIGIPVCPYICRFCRYYNRTGEKIN